MEHACLYKHLYKDLLRKQEPRETTTEKRFLSCTRQNGTTRYRYEDVDAMLKTLGIVFTDPEIDWLFDHHVVIAGNDAMTVFFWDQAVAGAVAAAAPPAVRRVADLLDTESPVYCRTVSEVTFGRGKEKTTERGRTSRVIIWIKKESGASRL